MHIYLIIKNALLMQKSTLTDSCASSLVIKIYVYKIKNDVSQPKTFRRSNHMFLITMYEFL